MNPRLVTCCLCRCAFAGTGARAYCWGCYQWLVGKWREVR